MLGFKADFFTHHTLYNAVAPPSLPKRPMTAYFLFAQEERPKVAKLYPSTEIGQIAKERVIMPKMVIIPGCSSIWKLIRNSDAV